MENFFTRYTDSKAVFPSFPIVQHNCLGSWDVFLSLFPCFTLLPHPTLLVAIQDPPSRRSVLPTFPGFVSFTPPPPGCPRVAICFSSFEPTLVLLHCLSRLLRDAFSGCSFCRRSFWIPPPLPQGHLSIPSSYEPSSLPLHTT